MPSHSIAHLGFIILGIIQFRLLLAHLIAPVLPHQVQLQAPPVQHHPSILSAQDHHRHTDRPPSNKLLHPAIFIHAASSSCCRSIPSNIAGCTGNIGFNNRSICYFAPDYNSCCCWPPPGNLLLQRCWLLPIAAASRLLLFHAAALFRLFIALPLPPIAGPPSTTVFDWTGQGPVHRAPSVPGRRRRWQQSIRLRLSTIRLLFIYAQPDKSTTTRTPNSCATNIAAAAPAQAAAPPAPSMRWLLIIRRTSVSLASRHRPTASTYHLPPGSSYSCCWHQAPALQAPGCCCAAVQAVQAPTVRLSSYFFPLQLALQPHQARTLLLTSGIPLLPAAAAAIYYFIRQAAVLRRFSCRQSSYFALHQAPPVLSIIFSSCSTADQQHQGTLGTTSCPSLLLPSCHSIFPDRTGNNWLSSHQPATAGCRWLLLLLLLLLSAAAVNCCIAAAAAVSCFQAIITTSLPLFITAPPGCWLPGRRCRPVRRNRSSAQQQLLTTTTVQAVTIILFQFRCCRHQLLAPSPRSLLAPSTTTTEPSSSARQHCSFYRCCYRCCCC